MEDPKSINNYKEEDEHEDKDNDTKEKNSLEEPETSFLNKTIDQPKEMFETGDITKLHTHHENMTKNAISLQSNTEKTKERNENIKKISQSNLASKRKESSDYSTVQSIPIVKVLPEKEGASSPGIETKPKNEMIQQSNKKISRKSTTSSKNIEYMDVKHEDVSVVSKSFKRKLSRMSSKVSSMSRKKMGGFKGKLEEVNKKIKENQININKLLEDMASIHTTDNMRQDLVTKFEGIVTHLQENHEKWIEMTENLTYRQNNVEDWHKKAMEEVKSTQNQMNNVYINFNSDVGNFKGEYIGNKNKNNHLEKLLFYI